jgi:hypothetical protein
MLYSTIKSRTGNKAAQVFCTGDGWTRALPMKKEREAHEALSLLFHRDGVSNVMVMDGTKAQVEGEFRRNMCDAGCHIKQTEPYTASSNMSEGGVRELKKGVGRQILHSGSPKRFGGDCLAREADVRSHTALVICELEGQVPEIRVKGGPVDISTIAGYAWYEWIKFCDTSSSFPVSKVQLGRYLGAVIDIGPAMARNTMKSNGELMYQTYVRSLTREEIASPVEKQTSSLIFGYSN